MKGSILWSIGIGVLASVVVSLFLDPEYPDLAWYGYFGIGVMAALASDFVIRKDIRTVGLILLTAITFTLFFQPTLVHEFRYLPNQVFNHAQLREACFCASVGLTSLILGYFLAAHFMPAGNLLGERGNTEVPAAMLAGACVALVGFWILSIVYDDYFYRFKVIAGRTAFLLDQLPVLAIAVGYLAVLQGYKGTLFKSFLFGVLIPSQILLVISHTLFSKLVVLLAVLAVLAMLRTRRIPFLPLAVVLILTYPSFELRMQNRIAEGWQGDISLPKRLSSGAQRLVEGVQLKYITQAMPEIGSAESADARVNSLSLLAHCINSHTAAGKPFKYGSTFWWLPLAPVPRFLWPSKPSEDSSSWFGYDYNLKKTSEEYALVLPVMVETYINGGILGVIFINLFFGAACAGIYKTFQYGAGSLNLVALLSVISCIVYIESSICGTLGAAFQAMIAWFCIGRVWPLRDRRAQTLDGSKGADSAEKAEGGPGNLKKRRAGYLGRPAKRISRIRKRGVGQL